MKVFTVILHYGDIALTKKVANSFIAENIEYHVLDNCAEQEYPNSWKRLEKNIYWGGALKYCLEQAKLAGADYLWFLNNDIEFIEPKNPLKKLFARINYLNKNGKLGIYTPAVLKNPYHKQVVYKRNTEFTKVKYIDGIAPLINIDCAYKVKNLDIDSNIYGYGIESYLSLEIGNLGYDVIVDHGVVLKHEYHSTAKTVDGFLSKAAEAEHKYLSQRLGDDYREKLKKMQEFEVKI